MPPSSKPTTKNTAVITKFLNVDLDIFSRWDLQTLVTALGKKVIVLHLGRYKRTYETHLELAGGNPKSPDRAIHDFCKLIKQLPPAAREVWDAAKIRQFDIGIAKGKNPPTHWFTIESETIKATAEINARIAVTIYPPYPPKKEIYQFHPIQSVDLCRCLPRIVVSLDKSPWKDSIDACSISSVDTSSQAK